MKIARSSIYVKLLITYLVFNIMTVLVGVLTYRETYNVLKEELVLSNLSILEQSKDILELRLDEVEQTLLKMADNPKVIQFQYADTRFAEPHPYLVIDTRQELIHLQPTDSFADHYFVAYPGSDTVISSKGIWGMREYAEDRLRFRGSAYEEWTRLLTQEYSHLRYMPSQRFEGFSAAYDQTMVFKSLGYPHHSKGTLVAVIPNAQFRKLLGGLRLEGGGWAYIAGSEGEIIASLGEAPEAASEEGQPPTLLSGGTGGWLERKIGNAAYLATYTVSAATGWTYVVHQPAAVVLTKLGYITNTTLVIVLSALVVGVAAALWMASRNSKPFRKLIDSHEALEERLNRQLPLLRSAFHERLMQGKLRTEEELSSQLQHLGLELTGTAYVAALFCIEDEEDGAAKDERMLQALGIQRILLEDEIADILNGSSFVQGISEDTVAAIVPLRGDLQEAMDALAAALGRIVKRMDEKHGWKVLAAMGGAQRSLLRVSRSSEEAKYMLGLRQMRKLEGIARYDAMPEKRDEFYYPPDVETRLVYVTVSGLREEAEKLLEELRRRNFEEATLTSFRWRMLIYKLWGTALNVWDQLDLDHSGWHEQIERLQQSDDLAGYQRSFAAIGERLTEAAERMNARKPDPQAKLIQRIQAYIEARYEDSSLSLIGCAETVGVSEAHLSRLFKQQLGLNFNEYLEKLRIGEAQRLLRETELPVNQIGSKVGYNSANSFARAFKRRIGISATEFRERARESM